MIETGRRNWPPSRASGCAARFRRAPDRMARQRRSAEGVAKILDIQACSPRPSCSRSGQRAGATAAGRTAARSRGHGRRGATDAGDLRGRRPGIRAGARRGAGDRRRPGTSSRSCRAPKRWCWASPRYRDTCCRCCRCAACSAFRRPAQTVGREKVIVTTVGGVLVGLVADRMRAIVARRSALIDPAPPVLAARAGGESQDQGDLPRRGRPAADLHSRARPTVPGGRHAATGQPRDNRAGAAHARDKVGIDPDKAARRGAVPGVPAGRRGVRPADRARSTRSRACPTRSPACRRRRNSWRA